MTNRADTRGDSSGGDRITESLRKPVSGNLAVAAYLTAGFPDAEIFADCATAIAAVVDVLEVGVPFTDPMADGRTIQRTSEAALDNGVSVAGILESLKDLDLSLPTVLMSYLNPLMAYGFARVVKSAARSNVAGLIVPDLPLEESARALELCDAHGVALIQLVTPVSSEARMREICASSRGFVYAVATTGITGGTTEASGSLNSYLASVRTMTDLPVMAGFGLRTREQISAIKDSADGIVIGSALLEAIERGENPRAFIEDLIPRTKNSKATI